MSDLRTLALSNYGHFTSMRALDGAVRGLALHMERLRRDSATLFGAEVDLDVVREQCRARAVDSREQVLRVSVFGDGFDFSHPGDQVKPVPVVTSRPAAELPAPPLRTRTDRYVRDLPAVKHAGLFGTVYARRQAQLAGFDDVLLVDDDDQVYEAATSNLVFVAGAEVIWPIGESLPGVTMTLIRQRIPGTMAYVPRSEVGRFDAAFATNANAGVRAITQIDDATYRDDHPMLAQLREAYEAAIWEEL